MRTLTDIDICIPVYKPDDKLRRLFEGLIRQTVKPSKIIVMYTRSGTEDHLSPDLIDLGMKAGDLMVFELDRDEFDHGGTRAQAFLHSDADIMVMMTQDAIPCDEKLLEELTKRLDDPMTGVSYARQMPSETSSLEEQFTRSFNYPDTPLLKGSKDIKTMGIKAFFCSNVCAAYRRDVYDELGGFIKRTVFNEDMIFAHKLVIMGYKIYYAADARVIHTHDYSALQQLHRNFDLAVSQAMHPEVFSGISSEAEGKKYIKAAYDYFNKAGKPYLIIPFVWKCCFKYLGYLLGKNYKKLPHRIVMACAMNKDFFRTA